MENRCKQTGELRTLAESVLEKTPPIHIATLSPEQIQQTFHNLRVHQIELEMQNDELRRTQAELDVSKTRYFKLYDLAPVGYATTSEKGLLLEANLTAATLLGVDRGDLVNQLLTHFILTKDQDIYYLHIRKLMETGEPQECELRMVRADKTARWMRLHSSTAHDAKNVPVCRIVFSDITERKRSEEAVLRAADELERQRLELEARTADLEKTNATLAMMLDYARKIETDIEERVVANLRSNILNILDMMRKQQLTKSTQDLIELLEATARNLAHPLARNLESQLLQLTTRELQLAHFIKLGKSSKELMVLLDLSASTIETHRNNLRKKLGLHHKKINLRTFLTSEFPQ